MHYTYIVECRDKTLYTGWTTDLEKRIRRERSLPENLRPSFVMKNGGTNTAAAILVCIAYTLVSLVFTFIMVHI